MQILDSLDSGRSQAHSTHLYLYPGLGVYYECYTVYATEPLLSDQARCLEVLLMTWDEKAPLGWRPLNHPDIEKGQWSPTHLYNSRKHLACPQICSSTKYKTFRHCWYYKSQ